ncbi:hypothetical protein HDU76_007294 [Blyttiomyces sp. JEL0837]|nr:hypothetical protein HDU76_007294 [Blyttiomyces sp. JEL0837]
MATTTLPQSLTAQCDILRSAFPKVAFAEDCCNSPEGTIPMVIICNPDHTNIVGIKVYDNFQRDGPTIPTQLSQITTLTILDVAGAGYSGPIPDWITSSFPNMISLALTNNSFTGEIPSALGSLKSFMHIALGFNQLTGNIPDFIYTLKNLLTLQVNNNKLSGEISSNIENLSNMQQMDLSGNIEKPESKLPYHKDFSDNNLSGTIPDTTTRSYPHLMLVFFRNLDGNCINGSLPAGLASRNFSLGTQCGIAPTSSGSTSNTVRTFTQSPSLTSPNSNNNDNNNGTGGGNQNIVAIAAGSAVGGILLIGLIVFGVITWRRKSRDEYIFTEPDPTPPKKVIVNNGPYSPATNLHPGIVVVSPAPIQYVQPVNVVYSAPIVVANAQYAQPSHVAVQPNGYVHSPMPAPTSVNGYHASYNSAPVAVASPILSPQSVEQEEPTAPVSDVQESSAVGNTSDSVIGTVEDTSAEAHAPVELWSTETVNFWAQEMGLDFDIVEMLSAKNVDGKVLIDRERVVAICSEYGLEDDARSRLFAAIETLS